MYQEALPDLLLLHITITLIITHLQFQPPNHFSTQIQHRHPHDSGALAFTLLRPPSKQDPAAPVAGQYGELTQHAGQHQTLLK